MTNLYAFQKNFIRNKALLSVVIFFFSLIARGWGECFGELILTGSQSNFLGKTMDLVFKAEIAPDPSGTFTSSFFLDDVSIPGSLSSVSLKGPGQIPKTRMSCQQTVCNGDFENGPDGSWVITSSNSWEDFVIVNLSDYDISNHSGNYAAWLGGDPGEVTTITQQITLPGDATQLVYWYWIDSNDSCGKSKGTVHLGTTLLKTYDLCQVTSGWTNEKIAIPVMAVYLPMVLK